ncbi:MAG: hypothetical protein FWC47_06870 [Oscillospiraceae bacterium]|nr:hypothetical protein [Oscillospiraceae bacterium]
MNKEQMDTSVKETKELFWKDSLKKIGNFLLRNAPIICVVLLFIIVVLPHTVLATGIQDNAQAEKMWTDMATLIQKWVTRLGGVVMFVGGIMFGLGWKNDDAEGKSRGINTLIAGAIVAAVAATAGTFFTMGA